MPTIDPFEDAWQYAKSAEIEKKWVDFFEDRKSNKDMRTRVEELQRREAGRLLKPSQPIKNPVVPPMNTRDWLDASGQHDILDALGRPVPPKQAPPSPTESPSSPPPSSPSSPPSPPPSPPSSPSTQIDERNETVAEVVDGEPEADVEPVRGDVEETVVDFDIPKDTTPVPVESNELIADSTDNEEIDVIDWETEADAGKMTIGDAIKREKAGEGILATLGNGTKEFYLGITREEYDAIDSDKQAADFSVVENPFANPFYDSSAFVIRKEQTKGFVSPLPSLTEEIVIEKEQKPPEINGFKTTEGDDLSLLPASAFSKNDAPIADNMSLLPSGWKDE